MKKFNNEDRNKIIAIIATIIFALVVMIILIFSRLYYQWPPKDQPLPEDSELLFGGEYVMLGDVPYPTSSHNNRTAESSDNGSSQQENHDMTDAGEQGNPSTLISTNEESPMVTKRQEDTKQGPSKEELERRQREKYEKEKAREINRRVSFNTSGKSSGKEGSPDGNAETGLRSGAPGHTLVGRTIEYFERPSSRVDGKVIIEVRVNPKGYVIEASYKSGSGSAAASRAVRQSCIAASKKSRFSIANNLTNDQVGTITWVFE